MTYGLPLRSRIWSITWPVGVSRGLPGAALFNAVDISLYERASAALALTSPVEPCCLEFLGRFSPTVAKRSLMKSEQSLLPSFPPQPYSSPSILKACLIMFFLVYGRYPLCTSD